MLVPQRAVHQQWLWKAADDVSNAGDPSVQYVVPVLSAIQPSSPPEAHAVRPWDSPEH